MSQTLTFSKAVQQLYDNVNVENTSIDTVINEFGKVAHEHHISKSMSSLSASLDMDMDGKAKKISHVFSFIESPLPDTKVDAGYIKLSIGEVENSKKVIDIDWCFQFVNKAEAEIFFERLKMIFVPLSTKQKIGDDELNLGKYAEFSTSKEDEGRIKDVTFFLSKSVVTNKYEVRFIPYNEFVK